MSRCLIYTLITRHQGKKTRERQRRKKKRREPNNPNLQEFNDMYFIVSVHTYTYENVKETDESKNSNSIANGFEQGMWFKEVATMKETQTKILLHIITLKMHKLIHTNKLACMITFTLKVIHAHTHIFRVIRIQKQKHKFAATGVFSEFVFIMPISIFLSLVFFFWILIFFSSLSILVFFFLYSFTTYQCYLFFCVFKLCENQSKMNSLYFFGAISMV